MLRVCVTRSPSVTIEIRNDRFGRSLNASYISHWRQITDPRCFSNPQSDVKSQSTMNARLYLFRVYMNRKLRLFTSLSTHEARNTSKDFIDVVSSAGTLSFSRVSSRRKRNFNVCALALKTRRKKRSYFFLFLTRRFFDLPFSFFITHVLWRAFFSSPARIARTSRVRHGVWMTNKLE